ncbi:lipopolysaccharide biosynthesis protein [Treponema sp.]|uniref:lipopolysaccharide biosynthesis protein n=1 Tax=Treponema sp. TaxID=166 RepID=UPI00298E45E7|nr:lipopolysaccharide biosynthesis protein [Treponema sp.]
MMVQDQTELTQSSVDEEISLIDLLAVLLKKKWLIIGITGAFMVFALVFSVFSLVLSPEKSPLPNLYTPKAEMLIREKESGGGSLSSMISASGLGGLAGLAGISAGGGSSASSLAQYIATSNNFLDSVVDHFGLIQKWKIERSPRTTSRAALKKVLLTDYDDKTGVFSISCKDIDPAFACDVVNYAVSYMEERFLQLGLDSNLLKKKNLEENIASCYKEILSLQQELKRIEFSASNAYSANNAPSVMLDVQMKKLELSAQEQVYASLKGQYEVLKIDLASETPLFQVLERAEIPDQKSGPSRGKLCIILTFAGAFISIFLAFLLNAIENIRNDKEAMAKLRIGKEK